MATERHARASLGARIAAGASSQKACVRAPSVVARGMRVSRASRAPGEGPCMLPWILASE